MILLLSLGFGLGVLACVAADAVDRRRHRPTSSASTIATGYGAWTAGYLFDATPATFGSVTLTAQDSTLSAKDS